jgi:phosphatidylserine/phosphatidylglycerophosphate/cardiolipin synthase-like enzyme
MTVIPPATSGTYPRRDGNRVRPLVDGEPAFRRICQAVEAARRRVWVTVAFLDHDVQMPDGHGTFFDVLERAAARGLDVRALFWREPELGTLLPGSPHFLGSEEERAWLRSRDARFLARWDHLPRYCHHQKSWMIDAGEPEELAFVGGINLDHGSIVPPGHPVRVGRESVHDVYAEIAGPASTDVVHNFVQRWNEASERERPDGRWPETGTSDLPFPTHLAAPAGDAPVQITRTVRAGCYAHAVAAPGAAAAYDIARGESSILEQYVAAIDAAREGIYIENQFIASAPILAHLHGAVQRGVEVVIVVPGVPMPAVAAARAEAHAAPFFDALGALGMRPNFSVAALAATDDAGRRREIYVHAKIMLVDDVWATIGSANFLTRSFHADTELNASVWHPPTARALRAALLREHTGIETGALGLAEALQAFVESSAVHRDRHARGMSTSGLAYAVDPARYGL